MLAIFLGALDQTIVAVSMPAISGLNAAPGDAQDALRAELLLTFRHLLMVSAAVSLLGLAAAIAMPNRVLRGREDKVR
ncbi:hypothetical protein [Pseudomonas frederiksbergensis]